MRIFAKWIVFLHLIAILLVLSSISVYAEQKNTPATQDQVARKRIAELESQLKAQAQEISQTVKNQDKEIDNLKNQNVTNSELSSKGAIILLIGLLLGVLGALLLGAPVLTSNIEELSDLKIDSSIDIAFHAPKKDAVLGFYSVIGHIFLLLGFVTQFAGTAIVLNVAWISLSFLVLGGLIFSIFIVFFILGFDPTQTHKQKLIIVWKNILRIAKLKISVLLLRGRECEGCLKKVKKGQSHIFWYDQGNSPDHPYLYPPSQFLVGHEECVDKKLTQKIEAQANCEQKSKIQLYFQKMKGLDFISTKVDNYKQWFADHYEHWSKIRVDWPKPSKQEIALDSAIAKLKKIDS
jgi:hypothetical protein